ncbi:hypothetical protein VNO77_26916 [Canavalia gladiata]|uniref:Uncharacterized protein n=1 Tax=Canavalia gladiata TaxID=3824 RepID=A0AAN9KW91_CANGL
MLTTLTVQEVRLTRLCGLEVQQSTIPPLLVAKNVHCSVKPSSRGGLLIMNMASMYPLRRHSPTLYFEQASQHGESPTQHNEAKAMFHHLDAHTCITS